MAARTIVSTEAALETNEPSKDGNRGKALRAARPSGKIDRSAEIWLTTAQAGQSAGRNRDSGEGIVPHTQRCVLVAPRALKSALLTGR